MRTRPLVGTSNVPSLALLAAFAWPLLCWAAPARAAIDAVDEPTLGEAPAPQRPTEARPARKRLPPKPQPADEDVAPEDEAAPAPEDTTDEPVKAAPPKKKVEAPPAVPVVAPPPPVVSKLTPIALPQGGLAELLSHFRARQKAVLEQDPRKAEAEAKALRELKTELGFPDFQTVGKALVREGQRRLEAGQGALARSAALLAVDLSPGLPEAWWLLARSQVAADGPSATGAAVTAAFSAVRAELADPLGRRALFGNLAVAAIWAALAALSLALLLIAGGAVRYTLHDFHHLFPNGASPVQTGLLGLILLAVPWLFRLGPFAILASLAIAAWMYVDRQGRVVVALALLVAVLAPLALGEIASRVYVSPLALDLWTAQTDLDATAAESRLTVLAQATPPNVAALAVLGSRAKRLGRLDEAEGFYQKALQVAANRPDLENNLGNVRLLKGDLPGAKSLYEAAIDHDPGRAAAYFNLGQCFSRMLQLEQSQEAQRHALELDRALIEQHMSAPPRANVFLIDSGIVFADVAALGSSPELASRGVRQQAERRIFGAFEPVQTPAIVFLLAALVALGVLRARLRPSEACRKCGRPVCARCDPGLPSEGLCGQCVNVFLRKSVADPPARIRKEAKVKAYQIFRLRLVRGLAVLLGGGGHIAVGETGLGAGLLFGLVFFGVLATGLLNVLRPPEEGIVATVAAVVAGLVAVLLYIVAVRDLFSKTR